MTKREIANLCCRLLAVYTLIQALPTLTHLFSLAMPLVDRSGAWTSLHMLNQILWAMQPVLLLTAAFMLWRWSGLIAAWMVGYDLQDQLNEPESFRVRPRAAEVHAIAFSTIGLWVLVEAAPMTLGYVVEIVYTHVIAKIETDHVAMARYAGDSIDLLVRLIIGLWLLFGASGLVRVLHGLRNVGLEPSERPLRANDRSKSGDSHDT